MGCSDSIIMPARNSIQLHVYAEDSTVCGLNVTLDDVFSAVRTNDDGVSGHCSTGHDAGPDQGYEVR